MATELGLLTGRNAAEGLAVDSRVLCSIRPEAIRLSVPNDYGNRITATVERTAFLGEVLYVHLRAGQDLTLLMLALQSGCEPCQSGATLTLSVAPEQVIVMAQ